MVQKKQKSSVSKNPYENTKIIRETIRTNRISFQQWLSSLISYDKLTGLPDYDSFNLKAAEKVVLSPKEKYAVIYADIINFKYFNYTFGYEAGNVILRSFAEFIASDKANLCACRIFSDNFIYLRKIEEPKLAALETINQYKKFAHEQNALFPESNLLIAAGMYPVENKSFNIAEAVDKSNIARKILKKSARTDCLVFDDMMKQKLSTEMELTSLMAGALQKGEFLIYLQPKICLRTHKIVGAEALIRWQKAGGEMLLPVSFVPVFENNGLIADIDLFVCEEVCRLLRSWLDEGKNPEPISVNLSRINFNNENFMESIINITKKYNIPPRLLEFELTETAFTENCDTIISTVGELKKLGFAFSIDDFGSGYSSLNLIKNLQVDVLKLDKSLFGLGQMACRETVLISNIVRMAKELDMLVLCEGVENQEQLDFLSAIGCDLAQGYFFNKPMPINNFLEIMFKS